MPRHTISAPAGATRRTRATAPVVGAAPASSASAARRPRRIAGAHHR
ncbi:hypothetical protein RKE29_17035 [Streptomyces sp. B1866]|nr:hypothetical protein [Streptomyces sp. B1866]MDT3398330.1 hypothetical protein [Streptomyces sp. B1866]